jgi:hypothetical protein
MPEHAAAHHHEEIIEDSPAAAIPVPMRCSLAPSE